MQPDDRTPAGTARPLRPIDGAAEPAASNPAGAAPTVVVCGSIHQDTIAQVAAYPVPGESAIVDDVELALGGKGANQASAAAHAGVRAVMAGTVGEDPAADLVLAELGANGVDVHSIQTTWDEPTGSAFIATTPEGKHMVFVTRGANTVTDPLEFVDDIAAADIVLAQGELRPEATEQLGRVANLHGTRFILNLAPVTVVTPSLIDSADPLIVNRTEAREVLRELDAAAGIRRGDLAAQIESLLQYCPSVVVSMGDEGCVYARAEVDGGDGVVWHQPPLAVPAEEIVDTTGAGDAFVGTIAAELARGESMERAVALGTAAGSLAVRSLGATSSYADRATLEAAIGRPGFPARRRLAEATPES
ncbi:PfkB family carbohydrate kinase [uncultured Corynebacterium sp.]|uniref:PfkB family carbohydrate kinase n=1 Tax=uncultured Corynebacterium sp. TaxID=159447 RepID=UPI0025EFCE17|nr:PfkB family carbohydrate kinase [uncultured Corynebacterium sp.]